MESNNATEEKARREAAARELELIRALIGAAEADDLEQLSDAQMDILKSDMALDLPDEIKEAASLPTNSPHLNDPNFLEGDLAPNRFRKSINQSRSSTDIQVHGMSELQMAEILGSEEEDDYMVQVKLAIQERNGHDFFDRFEDIATDLDFWVRACLRARRFRIDRAVDLLFNYAKCKEELDAYITNDETAEQRVRLLLQTGVIHFLGKARCKSGRGILLLAMRNHDPKQASAKDFLAAIHKVIISAIREFPGLQANGFTIIHDMTGLSMKNIDTNIPKLMSKSIESKLPFRYGQLVLLNPPTFFGALFRVLSLFLSPKMRGRIVRVYFDPNMETKGSDGNPLETYIRPEFIPENLGGSLPLNYQKFASKIFPSKHEEIFQWTTESKRPFTDDANVVAEKALGEVALESLTLKDDSETAKTKRSVSPHSISPQKSSKEISFDNDCLIKEGKVHSAFV